MTREMQMKRKARGAITISFFVLILAWLPWVISYLPGSDCPDLGGQLRQFLGITDYSTHHPIVSTLIYGTIYSIGMLLGSGDFGYLFIVIVQTLGFAAVCAYEAYEVGVLTNSHTAYRITIAFFAILPVFGSYCQWCVKDSLFAIAFGLYATLVAMCVINPNKFFESKRQLTGLCMAAIATGLLRNNGLYAVAFSLPFLALLRPKGKRFRMTIILIVTVLIILITNATVKIVTNASSDTIKESFSIPFQQTARYVREHSDEVTDSEREAINAVLDYENLATLYNEDTSDPVKATYKSTATMQDVIRYLRTWISQGLKSPKCYLCATLRQTYGYWYPEQGIATHDFEFCAYVMFENVAELRDTTYWMPEALRTFCQNWRKIFNAIPIAGYFLTPGIYTWLLVLEAGYLVWRKKTQNLLILLPCIVLTLTCIAGPLNGSVRYSLGVITAMPVCLAASMFTS
ncbi:MAG: DUF6020 family protein [Lachnospiraceae bacterium]|nr:DUF6020 family protein [Lachnospiraceae bacterium]